MKKISTVPFFATKLITVIIRYINFYEKQYLNRNTNFVMQQPMYVYGEMVLKIFISSIALPHVKR